ncbi:NAD(P)-dependent malic enzyme [Stackebrandtia nassauensis]|uniref:Malate dehydrogenase (Oxaloacetate-decarboxylating) n=1 Tax=Stackebrandtia nassauensis (strain DSM 44728 / CIP 108903 / NRRL B-16338 / NBRC 102104 / LLR-40K-21) TaxID=446470 RepID=D3QAZ7_STANL|nr:NADP-dependent malic enzyme [Stackebrandtia nassauensis]ADD44793.1 Malate dehydrogenase (oxaloacetate- decarboxylating) [Stackebrandtia nassauensis DSM 44728]
MTDNSQIMRDHEGGKLRMEPTRPLRTREDLSIAYTPGVAEVCRAIHAEPALAKKYTWTSRLVAVVSDGTSVLGLGDIGPAAAMPVMEGKAVLFRKFANVDAIPICLDTTDPEEIIATVKNLAPSFGGINLEDISAPRCFEIEARLEAELDIPVMHDDQHGTAVVVLAALRNAMRLTDTKLADSRVVVMGAGAAGVAVSKMLISAGIGEVTVCDSRGIIHSGRDGLNPAKEELAEITNASGLRGDVEHALRGANVLVGLSGARLTESQIATMASDAIIFALSNPDPEVSPTIASKYASVVATGRSDMPNQINNVLAFPGIFAGAFDAGARNITPSMKLAASEAIADCIGDELGPEYIVPSPLDPRVAPAVSVAVAAAARADAESGAS